MNYYYYYISTIAVYKNYNLLIVVFVNYTAANKLFNSLQFFERLIKLLIGRVRSIGRELVYVNIYYFIDFCSFWTDGRQN